jgi:hypothetical protein
MRVSLFFVGAASALVFSGPASARPLLPPFGIGSANPAAEVKTANPGPSPGVSANLAGKAPLFAVACSPADESTVNRCIMLSVDETKCAGAPGCEWLAAGRVCSVGADLTDCALVDGRECKCGPPPPSPEEPVCVPVAGSLSGPCTYVWLAKRLQQLCSRFPRPWFRTMDPALGFLLFIYSCNLLGVCRAKIDAGRGADAPPSRDASVHSLFFFFFFLGLSLSLFGTRWYLCLLSPLYSLL